MCVCVYTHSHLIQHASIKQVPFAIIILTSQKRKLKDGDTAHCARAHSCSVAEPELIQGLD